MAWITPKTDWLASDFYDFSDLNRVENNIEYVRLRLGVIGYSVPSMTFIKDRTNKSYDLLSSINRIESNIDQLASSFVYPPGWLPLVFWQPDTKFTEYHANRWESNVSLLKEYSELTEQAWRYAGTFNAGTGVTIL